MTILDQLADYARERVKFAKGEIPADEIRRRALAMEKGDFSFEKALGKPGISFICECKKASPSKGLIAPEFPYLQIAKEYENAGADAISVLTEPKWFLGKDEYLREIAESVKIPCLRKDFTVNEYMIYEAKLLGASAVLLICSILSKEQLKEYREICDELGLSALVEAHDEAEVETAVASGARIIGVNNRNLKDFSVDTENSRRLRSMIPKNVLFVSESGVKGRKDVEQIIETGADAVLIGEALMRAENKKEKLAELRGGTMTKVKLCGLRYPEDIQEANRLHPEYIGFVFAEKSRRFVTREQAENLKRMLDPSITAVGVFVDETPETVAGLLNAGVIDAAQLHGKEDEDYIGELKKMTDKLVIKAVRVRDRSDVENAEKSSADLILFDAGAGDGKTFSWEILDHAKRPYILAGGLTPENAGEAVRTLHPCGVDVSSGIETDGKKDAEKMKKFVDAVRNA